MESYASYRFYENSMNLLSRRKAEISYLSKLFLVISLLLVSTLVTVHLQIEKKSVNCAESLSTSLDFVTFVNSHSDLGLSFQFNQIGNYSFHARKRNFTLPFPNATTNCQVSTDSGVQRKSSFFIDLSDCIGTNFNPVLFYFAECEIISNILKLLRFDGTLYKSDRTVQRTIGAHTIIEEFFETVVAVYFGILFFICSGFFIDIFTDDDRDSTPFNHFASTVTRTTLIFLVIIGLSYSFQILTDFPNKKVHYVLLLLAFGLEMHTKVFVRCETSVVWFPKIVLCNFLTCMIYLMKYRPSYCDLVIASLFFHLCHLALEFLVAYELPAFENGVINLQNFRYGAESVGFIYDIHVQQGEDVEIRVGNRILQMQHGGVISEQLRPQPHGDAIAEQDPDINNEARSDEENDLGLGEEQPGNQEEVHEVGPADIMERPLDMVLAIF